MQKRLFRVIIAGSRTFGDYPFLRERCDAILCEKANTHTVVIVSGTARGADRLGERYARERGYQVHQFPANWNRDGHAAGPIRNRQMADNADALIAFWDGCSRGTENMIYEAKARDLPVRIIKIPYQQTLSAVTPATSPPSSLHAVQEERYLSFHFH